MHLLRELSEMTMKAGNLGPALKNYFNHFSANLDGFVHVGDIEKIQVLKKDDIYFLKTADVSVGFFQVLQKPNSCTLQNAFIDDSFRGLKLFEKFIWFLKRNEGYDKIFMGDTHSKDMQNAIKSLSHRFNISWVKDNEKQPYNPDNTDKYYHSMKPTGWVILLENDGDFTDWPKFFNEGLVCVKQYYDWILDKE
jgi:hypothetical protein